MTLVSEHVPGATPITVWSLETTSAADVRPGRTPDLEVVTREAAEPKGWLSAACYRSVGGPWHWVDRAPWSREQWGAWADRPELHLVTCWAGPALAGYYELEQQADGAVEIAYFGLTARAVGHGVGGWLLGCALEHAWRLPATQRVWVHTCTLDSPAALPNYRSRGMRVFAEQTEWRLIPA